MPNPVFQTVRNPAPGRSVFDLSYSKLFTCDMGQLIPVLCDEVVPGDRWQLGNEIVVRFQPLVAPILHEINAYVHYFFVPYRILDENFEPFITGGVDGQDHTVIPRWEPGALNTEGSLWDFMGFPIGVDPDGAYPIDYPRRAYNLIWNQYYRDETLQTELDITDLANGNILTRCWAKDYFTSALPWQQRGTAPALPISGTSTAVWPNAAFMDDGSTASVYSAAYTGVDGGGQHFFFPTGVNGGTPAQGKDVMKNTLHENVVDLSVGTSFDVADIRLAFQVQKWMERNARSGVRYTEFLQAHFGIGGNLDSRLQRPEYIGGSKSPIIVSEVLQTSSTDLTSPQGNMAGHGISATRQSCGSYQAQEFGVIIGLLSVMPEPMYQQGINRQWLRRSKYDFYFPEFATLSEQAIEQAEIYATDVAVDNIEEFGFQGRYDELRYKPNMVCSGMRSDAAAPLDFWHLARYFGSKPELNDDFLKCEPDKRIFAVPSEPGLIVSFGNIIKAMRPIPVGSEPGLIDHH